MENYYFGVIIMGNFAKIELANLNNMREFHNYNFYDDTKEYILRR
jgi:hypothetical protein